MLGDMYLALPNLKVSIALGDAANKTDKVYVHPEHPLIDGQQHHREQSLLTENDWFQRNYQGLARWCLFLTIMPLVGGPHLQFIIDRKVKPRPERVLLFSNTVRTMANFDIEGL